MLQKHCCCPCTIHEQAEWLTPADDPTWQVGKGTVDRELRSPGWYGVGYVTDGTVACCADAVRSRPCQEADTLAYEGGKDWTDPAKCQTAVPDLAEYAEFTADASHRASRYLRLRKFALDLPTGERTQTVVSQIKLRVYGAATTATPVYDKAVYLYANGDTLGDDLKSSAAWSQTPLWREYTVAGSFLGEEVSDEGFGVVLAVVADEPAAGEAEGQVRVYAAELEVTYTVLHHDIYYAAIACDDQHLESVRWLKKPHPTGAKPQYLEITAIVPQGGKLGMLIGYDPFDDGQSAVMATISEADFTLCPDNAILYQDSAYFELGSFASGEFSVAKEGKALAKFRPGTAETFRLVYGWDIVYLNFSLTCVEDWTPGMGNGPFIGLTVLSNGDDGTPVVIRSVTWTQHRELRPDCPDVCCKACFSGDKYYELPKKVNVYMSKFRAIDGLDSCSTYEGRTWTLTRSDKEGAQASSKEWCFRNEDCGNALNYTEPRECNAAFADSKTIGIQFTLDCAETAEGFSLAWTQYVAAAEQPHDANQEYHSIATRADGTVSTCHPLYLVFRYTLLGGYDQYLAPQHMLCMDLVPTPPLTENCRPVPPLRGAQGYIPWEVELIVTEAVD